VTNLSRKENFAVEGQRNFFFFAQYYKSTVESIAQLFFAQYFYIEIKLNNKK